MKFYTEGTLKPIQSWCDTPEEGCLVQARNLANLPFAFRKVCLMPDTHQGYGMPVGGVLATDGVVIPNAVGVDIGCGMLAIKSSLKVEELSQERLKSIMQRIRSAVPVGFNMHQEAQPEAKTLELFLSDDMTVCKAQWQRAQHQIGTLGGGNHFIEMQADLDGNVWFMLHSGSRNLGKQVADWHNKAAVEINGKYHSSVPKEWELAFLPLRSYEADAYLKEMDFCMKFAMANRSLMASRIKDAFDCDFPYEPINIHHNYAALENHFGRNVMVHRKGATSARLGQLGIIPGSQGTGSYIVKGLGNAESFTSCSHGAGRKMGRKEAIRKLDLDAEIKALEARGVLHAIRTKEDLDEAPGSYKDISTVIAEQSDLVEVVTELRPLAVIKG